jgi:hypothetical protein
MPKRNLKNIQSTYRAIASKIRSGKPYPPSDIGLAMTYAFMEATILGINKITFIEFGVASGQMLKRMAICANLNSKAFGVDYQIYGFDTGSGLPELKGYRDHPSLWTENQYAMDKDLKNNLPPKTKLILGDIADTLKDFLSDDLENQPIGYISCDVDLYHSAYLLCIMIGAARRLQ